MASSNPTSNEKEGFEENSFDGLIFLNERGYSLNFILLMDDCTERDELIKRLQNRLGSVHTSVEDIGPYSIVLTDESNKHWKHEKIEKFQIAYLDECFNHCVVADINRFLWDTSKIYNNNIDYMDVIYDRKYSWDKIPDHFRKPTHVYDIIDIDSDKSSSDDIEEVSSKADIIMTVNKNSNPPPRDEIKNTRIQFSRSEKEAIVKYIIDHKYYDKVRGNSIWKEMERQNVCPIRTWKSLKNHAVKYISKEIYSYTWLTPKQSEMLYKALNKPKSKW